MLNIFFSRRDKTLFQLRLYFQGRGEERAGHQVKMSEEINKPEMPITLDVFVLLDVLVHFPTPPVMCLCFPSLSPPSMSLPLH